MHFDDVTSEESAEALAFCFTDPEHTRLEVCKLLQELIRNACVNRGDGLCEETHNAAVVERYLASKGISCERHSRADKPNRPNLIATLGSGSPRLMLGPSHLDVVPVSSDGADGSAPPGWQFPPFSGELHDGVVHGRGSVDMLNTVAAQVVAFAAVAASKRPLKGTLVLCLVSDEEAGGRDGAQFVTEDAALRQKFRADFCLTELGGAAIPDSEKTPTKSFIQAVGEKGCGGVTVSCRGRGGHGSIPENGDNALTRAAKVISNINSYTAPTVVLPAWRSFVGSLDAPWLVKVMLTVPPLVRLGIWLLRLIKSPLMPLAHAITRMTMAATHIRGTLNANVIPGSAEVLVDVRTLPGQDEAYVLDHIRRALGRRIAGDSEHYVIELTRFSPASASPTTGPRGSVIWAALAAAAAEVIPGATIVPTMLPGTTDCRFFRRTGALAYGANLLAPEITTTDLTKRFHGDDERICLRSLWTSVQFYALVVKEILCAPDK